MVRVKRGTISNKRRRNVLKKAKGYRHGRKSKERLAKVAVTKAGSYARRDRRAKKGIMRRLWQTRLNAAVRERGGTYSTFIAALKKKGSTLDRKILSEIARTKPKAFDAIYSKIMS